MRSSIVHTIDTGNQNFDSAFFSFLRSIANNYECAYITTSRGKLQDLCSDTDISESPFFNIFSPVPLGQFDDAEARNLILTPSAEAGIQFSADEVDFVLSMAGRHPLFIQMACAALFDHKSRDGAAMDMEAVKADFLDEATQQLEHIWGDTDSGKQEVLCQIALGADVVNKQRYLLRELQRSGYLTEDPPAPFSQTFAEFLIAKRPDAVARKPVRRRSQQPAKRASLSDRIRGFFRRNGA